LTYIFAADSIGLSSAVLCKTHFSTRVLFGRLRSSKVIEFGTNRKRICDFQCSRIRILWFFLDFNERKVRDESE